MIIPYYELFTKYKRRKDNLKITDRQNTCRKLFEECTLEKQKPRKWTSQHIKYKDSTFRIEKLES